LRRLELATGLRLRYSVRFPLSRPPVSAMLHLRGSIHSDRPYIVFLHAIGTSGWMWQRQFQQLTDFGCLAPDLPGHGL